MYCAESAGYREECCYVGQAIGNSIALIMTTVKRQPAQDKASSVNSFVRVNIHRVLERKGSVIARSIMSAGNHKIKRFEVMESAMSPHI